MWGKFTIVRFKLRTHWVFPKKLLFLPFIYIKN
jgi:hypothetical protein